MNDEEDIVEALNLFADLADEKSVKVTLVDGHLFREAAETISQLRALGDKLVQVMEKAENLGWDTELNAWKEIRNQN